MFAKPTLATVTCSLLILNGMKCVYPFSSYGFNTLLSFFLSFLNEEYICLFLLPGNNGRRLAGHLPDIFSDPS